MYYLQKSYFLAILRHLVILFEAKNQQSARRLLIYYCMQNQANSSSIKVFVRVRPLVTIEKSTEQVVQVLSDSKSVRVAADQYTQLEVKFDHAFNSKASQGEIYSKLVDIVPRIMDGYNVTIFAYGQTGSGKTHTMFGEGYETKEQYSVDEIEDDHGCAGVIPRSIYQTFKKVKKMSNANVFCSFLQIYNEKIYDLLQDSEKPKPLGIHESKVEGIFVEGLTQFGVQKFQDCMELLKKGVKNRTIRQTSMNAKSSRSHTIFQLLIEIQSSDGTFLKGRLNLCDLAGSQKINKKEAMGEDQLKQLKNINLSLTTLGKVIYALSSGDKKAAGAFRESKLTRLLQESLTGNTFTFIFGNLSPSGKNMDETISTLKFVERANHITLKVKPTQFNGHNPDTVDKLKREVEYLKDLLNLKKQGINPEDIAQHLAKLKSQNLQQKPKEVSNEQFQKLMRQNRQMKKEIQQLQIKIDKSQVSQYSLTSQYTSKQRKKEQLQYYMPSSRGPSQKGSSQANSRLSASLIQAGQSIIFQKSTIDDSPTRAKEKINIAKRLQDMEDKKRYNEYKLIDQYENCDRGKKNRNSPAKINSSPINSKAKASGKRDEIYQNQKNKKRVDYSDKIKQLEARLFGK